MTKGDQHTDSVRTGFTMVEAVIALFLVIILALLIEPVLRIRPSNRRLAFRAQAAALGDEALNALRRLPFDSLVDQANGPMLNVLYNAGTWRAVADPADPARHSVPNVLELAKPSGSITGLSGRLQLPAGSYDSVTVAAGWKTINDSPAGWSVGYLLRARDSRNGYRLRVGATATDLDPATPGAQNVMFEKITGGISARLGSAAALVGTDAWFTLQIAATGSSFTVNIEGVDVLTVTDTGTPFLSGPVALLGWDGVHAEVDDVVITTAAAETWNFDTPASPTLPAGWLRLGVNDLPDGTPLVFDDNGRLTIEPHPAGSTTLKKVTITINWQGRGTTDSATITGLVGRNGFGL